MTNFVEVQSNWQKWEKQGDSVEGVLVNIDVVQDNIDESKMQKVYTLIQDDGNEILIGGRSPLHRNGEEVKVIFGLERVRIGQRVKLEYTHDLEPTKKGNNPAKIIKVYEEASKEQYNDVVLKYQGKEFIDTGEEVTL